MHLCKSCLSQDVLGSDRATRKFLISRPQGRAITEWAKNWTYCGKQPKCMAKQQASRSQLKWVSSIAGQSEVMSLCHASFGYLPWASATGPSFGTSYDYESLRLSWLLTSLTVRPSFPDWLCAGARLVYGQVDSVLEPRVNRYGGWMGSKASLASHDWRQRLTLTDPPMTLNFNY